MNIDSRLRSSSGSNKLVLSGSCVRAVAGLDGHAAAAIGSAAQRLASEDEREQVLAIKDLWSLSCDDPRFAITIGQSPRVLDRLLELCSQACSRSSPLPPAGNPAQEGPSSSPSWKLVILALHCLWSSSLCRVWGVCFCLIPCYSWVVGGLSGIWRPTRKTSRRSFCMVRNHHPP